MQPDALRPFAMFLYMAVFYPVCGALTFYLPLQCRKGRAVLWWAGTAGCMLAKALAVLAGGVGWCPSGTETVVTTIVSFITPLLVVVCFAEPLAQKGILFGLAAAVDSAITLPGMAAIAYIGGRTGAGGLLLGYALQAVVQLTSLYVVVRVLRWAKGRIAAWDHRLANRVGVLLGGGYLLLLVAGVLISYHDIENGAVGLLILMVTIMMLHSVLWVVVGEARRENNALRTALTEMDTQRAMQYNALRMQQKTLDRLHVLQHDVGNHYLALRGFLARGETAQAEAYLRELTENAPAPAAHYAANPIADVALAGAAQQCEEQGIAFTVSGTLPVETPLTATDLGCLLYNLLSNAVEGAARVPAPRSVAVRFAVQAQQLCISVSNTALPGAAAQRTSKADSENHGYGTRIIRDIAARYNGVYALRVVGGMAEADAMVSLHTQTQTRTK